MMTTRRLSSAKSDGTKQTDDLLETEKPEKTKRKRSSLQEPDPEAKKPKIEDECSIGRRSGRTRTPSKWLKDMEVNFRSKRENKKSSKEGISKTGVKIKKCTKADHCVSPVKEATSKQTEDDSGKSGNLTEKGEMSDRSLPITITMNNPPDCVETKETEATEQVNEQDHIKDVTSSADQSDLNSDPGKSVYDITSSANQSDLNSDPGKSVNDVTSSANQSDLNSDPVKSVNDVTSSANLSDLNSDPVKCKMEVDGEKEVETLASQSESVAKTPVEHKQSKTTIRFVDASKPDIVPVDVSIQPDAQIKSHVVNLRLHSSDSKENVKSNNNTTEEVKETGEDFMSEEEKDSKSVDSVDSSLHRVVHEIFDIDVDKTSSTNNSVNTDIPSSSTNQNTEVIQQIISCDESQEVGHQNQQSNTADISSIVAQVQDVSKEEHAKIVQCVELEHFELINSDAVAQDEAQHIPASNQGASVIKTIQLSLPAVNSGAEQDGHHRESAESSSLSEEKAGDDSSKLIAAIANVINSQEQGGGEQNESPTAVPTSLVQSYEQETEKESVEFFCNDCDYRTDKKANWYKHRKKHLGFRPYSCQHCNYRSTTSSNLKRHLLTHTDQKSFSCQQCSSTFRQKIHLERHIKYKHEEKAVKCELCDYVCANYNPDLKIHMKRRHETQPLQPGEDFTGRIHQCKECDFFAYNKRDLKQHMKFHRTGPELKLYCEQCSFVTDCESRLTRHLLTHTREKPFACGLCTYRGTQKEHVLRHMQTKHGIEIVRTRHLKPKRQSLLKSEPDTNNPEGLTTSLTPDQSSAGESSENISVAPSLSIDTRRRFKSREKVFSCSHCTMKFTKILNLYKHINIQHKEAQSLLEQDGIFSCIMCEFKTPKKQNLLVHMRKHNMADDEERGSTGGEGGCPSNQLFSCVLCAYTHPRRKNLYMHMKKKHHMQILVRNDGVTRCFVRQDEDVSLLSPQTLEQIASMAQQEVSADTTEQVAIIDEGNQIIQNFENVELHEVSNGCEIQTVVWETAQDSNTIVVKSPEEEEIEHLNGTIVDNEAADAIQGLQALAQQGLQTEAPPAVHSVSQDCGDIQLTEDQVMQLSSGDYIEINGEMYKVEFSSQEKT